MLLLVLAHVEPDQGPLVVEEVLGERLGELGLAHAGRAEEEEAALRAVRVRDAGPAAADGIRDRCHGGVLADDALVQLVLERDQPLGLVGRQATRGDAGPRAHDTCDVLLGHLLGEHAPALLTEFVEHLLGLLDLGLELRRAAVAELGGLLEVAVALGDRGLFAGVLELLHRARQGLDGLLLLLPLGGERGELLALLRQLGIKLGKPLGGDRGLVAGEAHTLDLQLADPAVHLVDGRRHRVDRDAQPCGCLVEQVDGLVRQEPVGEVAVRERGGGHEGVVGQAHPVVDLVALLEPPQDPDGVADAGFLDGHGLEPTLERRVLLDVAVLGQCGRTDHAQRTTREQWLEDVGGVHRALGATSADDGVQLVDEREDLTVGGLDLLEHRLEPLLELAAVLGTGDHRGQVELDQPLVLEQCRDVALDDPTGEPLGDGGLADTGFTDQDRVVLGPTDQHLDEAADLLVTTDDGVQATLACLRGQVAAVLVQRLVGVLRRLARDALGAADLAQRDEHGVTTDPEVGQHLAGGAIGVEQCQQQVLGREVLVVELGHLALALLEHRAKSPGDRRRASRPVGRRQGVQRLERAAADGRRRDPDALQQRQDDAVSLFEQGDQQVQRPDLGVVLLGRQPTGALERLGGATGETILVHGDLLACLILPRGQRPWTMVRSPTCGHKADEGPRRRLVDGRDRHPPAPVRRRSAARADVVRECHDVIGGRRVDDDVAVDLEDVHDQLQHAAVTVQHDLHAAHQPALVDECVHLQCPVLLALDLGEEIGGGTGQVAHGTEFDGREVVRRGDAIERLVTDLGDGGGAVEQREGLGRRGEASAVDEVGDVRLALAHRRAQPLLVEARLGQQCRPPQVDEPTDDAHLDVGVARAVQRGHLAADQHRCAERAVRADALADDPVRGLRTVDLCGEGRPTVGGPGRCDCLGQILGSLL